mmetsp:Transcript_8621/g.15081  ORF Transcript_8621/g.15081 Transcript_8621/m.15081 type:complete len:202 (+) Transcript_8621:1-606(+)
MTSGNVEDNVAYSFELTADDQWIALNETHPSIPHGAGALMSTPSELIIFIKSLFSGVLVSPETLQVMTNFTEDAPFGMGIFPIPFNTHLGFGHDGGIDGFGSLLVYFPEEDVAIAITGNVVIPTGSLALNDIAINVASIALEYKDTEEDGVSGPPDKMDYSKNSTDEPIESFAKLSRSHGSVMAFGVCLLMSWINILSPNI